MPDPGASRTAPAGAIWVSTAGNDTTGNGSQATPYRTIAKGVSVATAGSTVWVLPGTYTESTGVAAVRVTASGTSSSPITLMSSTVWGALIRPSASVEGGVRLSGQWIVVDGFDISETASATLSIPMYANNHNVTFQNNYVHDVATSRTPTGSMLTGYINATTDPDNVNVLNNVVVRFGPAVQDAQHHGIYVSGANWTVANNIIGSITGVGVHCWHGANSPKIIHNTIFNCYNYAILIGSGDSGAVAGGISNARVANNICYGNSRYAIIESGTIGTGNVYANNCLFNNTSGGYSVTSATPTGTVASDPLFLNYLANGTGDYHVAAGSPCVDAGTPTYSMATDLDGVTRPQGSQVDIGAYEKTAASSTATATPVTLTSSGAVQVPTSPAGGGALPSVGMYGPEVVLNGASVSPLPLVSTAVTVKNTDGSAATLYTNATGTTTTSNVVSTDSRGQLRFFAVPGYYDLAYTDAVGAQTLRVLVPTDPSQTYVTAASPTFTGGFGLGTAPTARIPVNVNSTLTPAPTGTSNKVGQFLSTTVTGNWATGTGTDPTFGFGLNVFCVTGTSANDGNGGTFQNLIEWDVQAPSGTIAHVTGLQAEASFYGVTSGATVTIMESMRVASPKRKNGAAGGTATNAYGLFIESFDGTGVGASSAFALFVEGGLSRFQGTVSVAGNINSYSGTLDLRPNPSLAQPYFQMTDIAGGGNATLVLGTAGSAFNVFDNGVNLKLQVNNTGVGFQGTGAIAKPTVTGSRGGNAALASLLTALANYGLITNSSTA